MHDDQLAVPLDMVRALIGDQFPAWRRQPITPVNASGTVNAIFRIGSELAARFPLRPDDPAAVREWLETEAWAFEQALGLVWYYAETNAAMSQMGRRTLERIEAAGVGA